MNKLISLIIFIAVILIFVRVLVRAQDLSVPLPPLGITQPGPISTTDYYDSVGNYLGQSQTNTLQPYPRQPAIAIPDYRTRLVPNGYDYRR